VNGSAAKVIHPEQKTPRGNHQKKIAGIQEGGIPAILVWLELFGPITGVRLSMDAAASEFSVSR
jgi:hypothetical protein